MSEPDAIQFACIGCGAMNPLNAATCSGCGHDFGRPPAPAPAPAGSPATPRERRPAQAPNVYAPPASGIHHAPSFRIGTAMIVVAVIAVGLGAFVADESLGIFLTIGLIPAAIRMAVVSGRGGPGGRPMSAGEMAKSFILTFFMAYLIVASSLIAFGVTCFPIGMASENLGLAIGVGGVAALGMGIWVTRQALAAARRLAEAKWHDSQIHWK